MREVPSTPVLLVHDARESQRDISHSPYTVGRMLGSDLLLEEAFVSRQHAEILFEEGSFYVVKERIETRWRTTCVATEAQTKTNAHEREKNHPD